MPRHNKMPKKADLIADQEQEEMDFEEEVDMSDEESDDMLDQIIPFDFEAYMAQDSDFHGIKRLLGPVFKGLPLDLSGLADIVISQNYIGSIVKQAFDDTLSDGEQSDEENEDDDKEQIYGVSTIINLTTRKDENPIKKLRMALLEKSEASASEETKKLMNSCLDNDRKNLGILISERFINLPAQFALPVYDSLIKEIDEAVRNKMPFKFTHLLMVCKILKEEPKNEVIVWTNPEEEFFDQECLSSFDYKMQEETEMMTEDEDIVYKQWRRVIILKASNLPSIINKIKSVAK